MKNALFNKICVLYFVFFGAVAQAQLPDFSLSVSKTNETCESNGTLTFTVQNTTAGSVITYSVFFIAQHYESNTDNYANKLHGFEFWKLFDYCYTRSFRRKQFTTAICYYFGSSCAVAISTTRPKCRLHQQWKNYGNCNARASG